MHKPKLRFLFGYLRKSNSLCQNEFFLDEEAKKIINTEKPSLHKNFSLFYLNLTCQLPSGEVLVLPQNKLKSSKTLFLYNPSQD